MNQLRSLFSATASFDTGSKKLGHPGPESNLASELKRSWPQQMHWYIPASLVAWYLPVKARSVPCLRVTSYCVCESCCLHSASDLTTFSMACASFIEVG